MGGFWVVFEGGGGDGVGAVGGLDVKLYQIWKNFVQGLKRTMEKA